MQMREILLRIRASYGCTCKGVKHSLQTFACEIHGFLIKHDKKQDNIPVGCIPPACQPYPGPMFRGGGGDEYPPPDIPTPGWVSSPHPLWTEWPADVCENITFPQLRWRAVIIPLTCPLLVYSWLQTQILLIPHWQPAKEHTRNNSEATLVLKSQI